MTGRSSGWRALALFGVFAISALPTGQTDASSAADSRAERIRRVESELLPITASRAQLGQYANVRDRMRAYGVPGISIAVINNGHIDWAKGYGLSDVTTGTAVTPDTFFQAASISKPLAALGALILVEQGKLGLDTDVNQYLQQWKVPTNQTTQLHPVTLRTLLDHSSGLTDVAFPSYPPGKATTTPLQTLKAFSADIRVETVPGRQYNYTATAFLVLQKLMEDVTKTPFAQYMQSQVLRPLDMAHSTYDEPLPPSLLKSAAVGYYAGGTPLPGGYQYGPVSAAAGLWATPSDLARYVIELQQDYAGKQHGLLSPPMARQMLTTQIAYRGLGLVMSGNGDDIRFGH